MYQWFNAYEPIRMTGSRRSLIIPPMAVELGELLGVIYRTNTGRAGQLHTYIHLMQDPPYLVSNAEGTQLYIVGGTYQVTQHGIKG